MSLRSLVKRTPILGALARFLFTFNKKGLWNPVKLARTIAYLPKYYSEYLTYRADAQRNGVPVNIKDMFPVRLDYGANWINRHYWFQDIYVAQQIIDRSRGVEGHRHVDIGSRLEGFVTSLISARVNLVFGDINLPKMHFENTEIRRIDLQDMRPEQFQDATSVSCLHVIEHLGLGKYGDKIDANGHYRVFRDLARVLPENVPLYISSPTSDEPGILFNAGRQLDPREMCENAVAAGFQILEKAFVTSDWRLLINPEYDSMKNDPYGCLILSLIKQPAA